MINPLKRAKKIIKFVKQALRSNCRPNRKKTSFSCRHSPSSPRTQQFALVLLVISLFALAIRVVVAVQLSSHPSVTDPAAVTDMAVYKELSEKILHGEWPDKFYFQPFYYAVFLPIVKGLLGTSATPVIGIQALAGALTVWLTGLTAARLFGRKAGVFAAALLAVYNFHIFYTPFHLIAVLQCFWLVLLTWLGLRYWARPTWATLISLGLTCAAATLTRGNVMLLVPVLLGLIVWRHRSNRPVVFARAFVLLVLFYVPQLPFAVHNYNHFGSWTGPSSAQPTVLALGNNPEAGPGRFWYKTASEGIRYTDGYREWKERTALGREDRTAVWQQMLHWMQREPLALPELKWRTFLLFWNQREIGNNINMQNEGQASPVLHSPVLLPYGFIGVLGLAGTLMLLPRLKKSPCSSFMVACIAVYALSCVLFFVLARFRLPLTPLLCVCAGYFVQRGWSLWRQRAVLVRHPRLRQRLVSLGMTLAIGCFLVYAAYPLYHRFLEPEVVAAVRPHGVHVKLNHRVKIHDHGPYTVPDWHVRAIPSEGITFVKTFDLKALKTPRVTPRKMEIALWSPKGATVRLRWQVVSPATGQSRSATFHLRPASAPRWKKLKFDGPSLRSERLRVLCSLRTVSGKAGVLLNPYRFYGRSRLAVTGTGETQVLPGELVFELFCLSPKKQVPENGKAEPGDGAEPHAFSD